MAISWNGRRDRGSFPAGSYFESSAQLDDAFLHSLYADAEFEAYSRRSVGHPLTVIADPQGNLMGIFPDLNLGPTASGVAMNIV